MINRTINRYDKSRVRQFVGQGLFFCSATQRSLRTLARDVIMNYRKTILFLFILLSLLTPSVLGADDYWGNEFRAVGASSKYLDAPGEGYSFRFTAQESKTVDKIALYLVSEGGPYNFSIGIEGDNEGSPDGAYIDDNEVHVTQLTNGGNWAWHTLDATVSLTNQTVYHITIRAVEADGSNRLGCRGTTTKTSATGRDNFIVTHNLHDASSLPLYSNDGSAWSVQNRSPVWLIHYTDETYIGVPYDQDEINSAYARVYGSADPYQIIEITENMTINTLGTFTRKLASPSDLNISLRLDGVVLRSVLIDPDDGSILYSWEQDSITRIVLIAGNAYRLYFTSPDSDSGNYWEIRHPFQDTSSDAEIQGQNWGGIASRGEMSVRHDYTFRFNQTAFPIGPTADADGDYSAVSGISINFDGTGSSDPDGTISSYNWNWGDGTGDGSGATPSHTYSVQGSYTVTLTVTDNEGMTGQATATSVISASIRETFQEVRDVWGTMFQLIVVVMAFALMIGLLKEETSVDEGEISVGEGEIRGSFLRAVLVLVAGTAVLFILLQVVERL